MNLLSRQLDDSRIEVRSYAVDMLLAALLFVTHERGSYASTWVAPLVRQSVASSELSAVDWVSDSIWLDVDSRAIAREIIVLLERAERDVDQRIKESVALPLKLWREATLRAGPDGVGMGSMGGGQF